MAEVLAGFLTSAVVNIAKDKLASAIAEQANLLWNFGDDLENMNSVLESISAALQDAERRSVKEKLVQLTTTIHSILDSGKLLAKARKLSGLSLYDSRLSYICCRNCSVRNLV